VLESSAVPLSVIKLSMLNLITIRSTQFREDEVLRQEMLDLMAPSYEDPTALFTRDLAHCNTLYLARDAEGKMICFFMVAWEPLETPNHKILPSIFLGVSAVRQDAKNSGVVGYLYHQCIADAVEWEQEQNEKLILWGTTATPTIYLAAQTFLADTEPRLDGSYSPIGAELAMAIHQKQWPLIKANDHPFVLKNVALNTRYSEAELERINRICQLKKFELFCKLSIEETNGDRLLFIARTPDRIP